MNPKEPIQRDVMYSTVMMPVRDAVVLANYINIDETEHKLGD